MAAISLRTGLPVHSAERSASGKATITLSLTLESTRLARPAIAFCSCSASGRLRSEAIMPPGNATYPPRPSTTEGCSRRMSRALSQNE